MAIENDSNHVSGVMAEALSHLNRVVEHLRGEDENEAANEIARDVHSMLDTFNHVTAPWDQEQFLMKPVPASDPAVSIRPPPPGTRSTWAAVAATDIPRNNRLVKFRPSDGLKRQVNKEELPKDEDYRCVWIYGWSKNRPLKDATQRVSYGAIFSMVYVEQHNATCVIFQYASSAIALVDEDSYARRDHGEGLFGPGTEIKMGEAYPENDELQRMSAPINERRRLTFARQQLFTNGMNQVRFMKDLSDIVGEHNIELVWLFNTGNATVVFAATAIARIIRDEFIKRSRKPGPYQEVQIGFSHDPCERPLNLITQIPCPGDGYPGKGRDRRDSAVSASNIRSYNPTAPKFTPGNVIVNRGKKGTDADGWQTVHRKR
ncbi:hypothetical protein H2204_001036 [Knufia peltigerae]|uniref:Uncharacterized protein n=1 Tax=Knufia peltigerae TaxID=1002370 RepID=A0AA38YDI3_9EURO|nr:hypothetical protein H2204_001036 [Knufia peltigerae]